MADGIRLHHLFMVVSDLSRSKRFYTELLGLRANFAEGQYVRLQDENGFHIGMEEGERTPIGGRGIEINFLVEDVDERYKSMVAKGLSFSHPPADMEWGARHAFFEDPDGYPLSVFTPNEDRHPAERC